MQLQELRKRALSASPPLSGHSPRCPARPRRRGPCRPASPRRPAPVSPRPLSSCALACLSLSVVAAPARPWRPAFCCGASGPHARRCRLRAAVSASVPQEPSGAATPGAPLASLPTSSVGTALWAVAGSQPPPPSRCTTPPVAPRWAPSPIAGCQRPALPCAPPTMPSAAGKGSRSR